MKTSSETAATDPLASAKQRDYVAIDRQTGFYVNLAGSYDYLELPYYISQDLEAEGKTVRPTCKEMLDAYIPPLFLEKAKLAGLPIPEYYISNGYFEPPAIIDPINPFMTRSRTIHKPGRQDSVARSMTRNFTYAVCCQELPPKATVAYFRSVYGWCVSPRFRDVSRLIWEVFHVPLARVRMVIRSDGAMLYSDISQLPYDTLGRRELAYLERRIRWDG